MNKNKAKKVNRIKRHKRVRAIIKGTSKRPRVAVFKSNRHIFVQFIDDTTGKTILSSKIISAKKSKIKETKTAEANSKEKCLLRKPKNWESAKRSLIEEDSSFMAE